MESEETQKSVIIVGAGVSGMAAAQTLNDHHIPVHLVEQGDRFGGHAAEWACMATDTCQSCSACLAQASVAQIPELPYVTGHLNSRVEKIAVRDGRYHVRINGGQTQEILADDIIIATGFVPADPPGLMGDMWRGHANVVTTAQLNAMLRDQTVSRRLKASEEAPRIGFVQCVGSRNREIGKDYCSQVCCRISMRQIQKLLHLYPNADITCFYIDLQVIGKEIRTLYHSLSERVRLIQGVPFEVFDDRLPDKLSVISEDTATGSRTLSHFDLLVLSVGMHENPAIEPIVKDLGLKQDVFGFLAVPEATGDTRIRLAGTAQGPMDIQSARQQGVAAAFAILAQDRSDGGSDADVAVIGDGPAARQVSESLVSRGYGVARYLHDDSDAPGDLQMENPDTAVCRTRIRSVNGTAGRFEIRHDTEEGMRTDITAAVVVADTQDRLPAGAELGLSQDRCRTLSRFLVQVEKDPEKLPEAICFWLDYSGPENRANASKILDTVLDMALLNKKITVLMNKMLVPGLYGQKNYDRARRMGVRFLRVETPGDVRVEETKHGLEIFLKEKTLGSVELKLFCDLLIIPEKMVPSQRVLQMVTALKDPGDTEGYYQANNVRHLPVQGLRKGLFYLWECREETDESQLAEQMGWIVDAIDDLSVDRKSPPKSDITINATRCKKCLTCYRVCPHGAIIIDTNTPLIIPHNCYGCGLCMSSCPALAIESDTVSDEQLLSQLNQTKWTVFACERSGLLAARDFKVPEGVTVESVPCVCRVGENVLLKAVEKFGRVILAGCHDGNCRSHKGSKKALQRVERIRQLPGINPDDIFWFPAAANESRRLEQFITKTIGGHHADDKY